MSPINWSHYTIEYKEAGDLLLANAVKTRRRNFMVFPTIFLYRHYIELILKEIILNNWEYLGISQPFPRSHNIYELWKLCRDCLQKTDKLVDPQFAGSEAYHKEIVQTYDALEADLNRFADIDPDSQSFRYPVDAKGNPMAVDNKRLGELLHELPELVARIGYNLDGISTGIYTILQDKYHAFAQQEHP